MTVEVLLTRAVSALNRQTRYKSPGRMPAHAANTWPGHVEIDCSGYIAWCLRFAENRKVDHPLYRRVNGGWFETTAIHADGRSDLGFFAPLDNPRPGAMLVYPDRRGADGLMHDGHIGIVVESSGAGIAGATRVIHCSLSQFSRSGDAVQITDASVWRRHEESLIVWFAGIEG